MHDARPAPPAATSATNQRWNFLINLIDVGMFVFGMSLISSNVIIPKFLQNLGAPVAMVAVLPALQILANRLPQMTTSYLAERQPYQKPYIMVSGLMQRFPWMVIGVLALAAGLPPAAWLPAGVMVCFLSAQLAFGLTAPLWSELIAKAIPATRRGVFMGLCTTVSNGLGVLGGLAVTLVLVHPRLPFPRNYAVLFLAASAFLWASYVFFALNRETASVPHPHTGLRAYITALPGVLRGDPKFRRLLAYLALSYAHVVGVGLFVPFGKEVYGLTDGSVGPLTITATATTLVASPLLGFLADRHGHRLNLWIAMLVYIAAMCCALLVRHPAALYVVMALLALTQASYMISTTNYVYELSPEGRRPTYVALAGTLPAPFVLLFSLGGAWLATHVSYAVAFAASGACCLAAVLVLGAPWASRPGQTPVLHAEGAPSRTPQI
jgi:MFS family permease